MNATPAGRRKRGRPVQADTAFRRVADSIRQRIARGVWKSGQTLPSQQSLSSELNSTLDTVRAATDLLKREGWLLVTPKRRLAVAGAIAHPQSLVPHRAILELVTMPMHLMLKRTDIQELQQGIESAAGKTERAVIIVSDYTIRHSLPSAWLDTPIAGVIVCGLATDGMLRQCQKLAVPVVLADYPSAPAGLRCVGVDNFAAAKEGTERLLRFGHRRIAFVRRISFVRKDIDPDSKERQAGFVAAMKAARLRLSSRDIFTAFHSETPESANIQSVAGPKSPYTAAFVSDVRTAQLVIQAAKKAGKRVPEDFSVACFQGFTARSGISGIAIDFREMGREAVRLLFSPAGKTAARVKGTWIDSGTAALVKAD